MITPLLKYVVIGAGYGVVRTTYKTHTAKIKQYNYSTHKDDLRPLMVTEKVPMVVLGSIVSSIYWPVLLYFDAYSIELKMKGYADDGEKIYSSPFDIVF